MDSFNPMWVAVGILAVLLVVFVVHIALDLRKKGMVDPAAIKADPKKALQTLFQQGVLHGGDELDALRDKVVTWLHAELDKQAAKATLKDRYFDTDDFIGDVYRLPAGYTATVTLTDLTGGERMLRPGSDEVVRYYIQPGSGNVTKTKPATP